jgi:hypothetical protein
MILIEIDTAADSKRNVESMAPGKEECSMRSIACSNVTPILGYFAKLSGSDDAARQ